MPHDPTAANSALAAAGLVAIDVHTHVHFSTSRALSEEGGARMSEMKEHFKSDVLGMDVRRLAEYYRERKMAAVAFTIDSLGEVSEHAPTNEEIGEAGAEFPDAIIPFGSVHPLRGKAGEHPRPPQIPPQRQVHRHHSHQPHATGRRQNHQHRRRHHGADAHRQEGSLLHPAGVAWPGIRHQGWRRGRRLRASDSA
jgi:hypothetical protein